VQATAASVEIGVDIGGTFTDVVCRRAGEPPRILKIPTTTGDPNTTASGDSGSDQPQGVPWGDPHGISVDGPPATDIIPVAPTAPVRITGDVKAPVVIHRVTPPYPRSAMAIHLNGSVIVECIIDKTGHVRDAQVLRSSSPLFNQSAIDAVLQWQFTPGSLHGTAVDTIFDLTVTFQVTQ